MALKTLAMGKGLLSIGSTGSVLDFTAQVTKCATKWKADAKDDTTTLSGDVLAGERTYTCQLAFTVLQDDLSTGGMVDYTWAHAGTEVPFTFTPASGSRSITGNLVVDPIDVGGDVGAKNTSDVTWDCVGEPELVANIGS